MFGSAERGGPIPFEPTLVDPVRLGPLMLLGIWGAISDELRRSTPSAHFYAEKLGDSGMLADSTIPLRLIDLVRDPRDVFCSIRSFTGGTAGFGRIDGQTDDEFLGKWLRPLQRLQLMRTTPPHVDRVLIRYEDLVGDFVGQADRLGRWLGLRVDPAAVLADYEQRKHHRTTQSVEESVGRWRRDLSADQSRNIWDALGSELELLGYADESPHAL